MTPTTGALIAAGGAGERMRALGPKPLIAVRGASLLERNLCALLGAGLRRIWVSCRGDAIRREVDRLAAAAARRGVAVEALSEPAALGTIGAAGLLRGRVDRLVTVNADNLTALDVAALIADHDRSGADLTLATHDHATRLPYGVVDCDGARVLAYREKPQSIARVASAVCVLGPAALAALAALTPQGAPAGLDALTQRLLAGGRRVVAHHHAAPWIDVNEPADLARAEALVAAHDRLECWARTPDLEVVGAVLRDGDRVLLEHRPDVAAWDTPGGKLEPGESLAAAIARELREELGVEVAPGPPLARFDQLAGDGRAIRHHVFAPAFRPAEIAPREGQIVEWFARARLPDDRAQVVARSLAAVEPP